MFKIFVTVDKRQGFKSLTVKWHLLGLNVRPATLKIRLLIISKLLTISSNCGLRSSASQHRTACAAFNLRWNEQWRQYSYASVCWTKRQWSKKPHWCRLVFFSSIWWITDDRLVICVVEKHFQLRLNYFIPLKKINLLHINYCTNYIHSLFQHLH